MRSFISKQFGNPTGLLGKFIGNGMAKNNVFDALWTVSLLNIQPHHHVLEVGFGPGVSTQLAGEKASQGFIAGIDHSRTMVEAASKRNADAIRSGRMELRRGEVSSLPYPEETFDIAFSLHSIYFWANPADCLRELRRVLKPSSLLAITIQPKDKWKPNVDITVMTLYLGSEVASLFSEAGFQNIRVDVAPQGKHNSLQCILGTK
jgi:ubiquinone/menaquinone biosynthesis C-methylase UbiE